MIARIEGVLFRRTMKDGYDMREVDAFLDQATEMLRQGHWPGAVPTFSIRGRGLRQAGRRRLRN